MDTFEEVAQLSPVMKRAVEVLAALSADPEARKIAEARQKELDEQDIRENEAAEVGRQEAISYFTDKMTTLGYPVDDIAKAMSLPLSTDRPFYVLNDRMIQCIRPRVERLLNELRHGLSNFEYVEVVAPGVYGGFSDVMFDIIPNLREIGVSDSSIEQILGIPLGAMKSAGYL